MYESIIPAIHAVNELDFGLFEDKVPCMQAANCALKYEVNFNTNNEDSNGFLFVQAIYKEEAEVHGELHNLLNQGKEYVIMLYTWRSCSRAIPSDPGSNPEILNSMKEATIEILKPAIERLKDFWQFQEKVQKQFAEEVEKLCKRRKRNEFLSEAYMLAMCNMLKMFVLLDEMKNMKASMKNDHTQYRRAQHSAQSNISEGTELSMFLAQQNIIRKELKERLTKIQGFEEFFLDLVNMCVAMYLENLYIFPEEKHTLVLVIAFSLYMMDTNKDGILININKIKGFSLTKIDQIFKECEVVNVFGDMSIYPFSFIQSTPNYDGRYWPENTSTKVSTQGVLLNHIAQFKSEYTALTAELARYSNLNVHTQMDDKEKLKPAYELALKSLRFLSKWTTQIIDTFSWKLGHLADPNSNSSVPADAEDYEKATRYNYSSQEKFALIEVIAMIKTIQNQLNILETHFRETIIPHIYVELQNFLHVVLPEIYQKLSKKSVLPIIVQSLWAVGLDAKATDIKETVLKKSEKLSGKKGQQELANFLKELTAGLKSRKIPPGSTQLYLIRCIVESLIQNKTKQGYRKELNAQNIHALEEFHKKSFFWNYMINFGETLSVCCDLSQLWYREFFLEMTNGKRIQFHIETSIPCILTNHILDTEDPAYLEYLLYPLDLYNDSAICALKKFKRQFLYNEIEAEVNFMMLQLVVRLSNQIFQHFKELASSMVLNKRFRNQVQSSGLNVIGNPSLGRYITLMKQRHLQLLGRSFNLSKLIAHSINKTIYESLETAVRRFRRNGLTHIMEFDSLIEVNRTCYQKLSQYLDLHDFDLMLTEITQSTTSRFGTISSFIINEIRDVLCPNFAFNSSTDRFIPVKDNYRKVPEDAISHDRPQYLWGTKSLNTCFETIFKLYSGYFGKEHIIKICQFLGYDGVFWLLKQVADLSEDMLKNQLYHYVSHIIELMPTDLSTRLDGKTSFDQIKMILGELSRLIDVKNITTEIAQTFHNFGNFVIFILKLENNMFVSEGLEMKQAYPFIGILPSIFTKTKDGNDEMRRKTLENKYQVYNIRSMMDKIGSPDQLEICRHQIDLTKERLSQENSIFKKLLLSIKHILLNMTAHDDEDVTINFWTRNYENHQNDQVEYDKAFYMVWSSILFIFAAPKNSDFNFDACYGDGLYWAGCTILTLIGHQKMFEWHNICGKLMRSHRVLKKDSKTESELDIITTRIKSILQIHNRIFDVLNRHLLITDDYSHIKKLVFHLNPKETFQMSSHFTGSNEDEYDNEEDFEEDS